MHRHTLKFNIGNQLPPWLFGENGGILVSGDSGSGKSTLLCLLMVMLARLGFGFTLLDPHGDLARKVKRLLLALGESVRQRVHFVCPADTSVVTKINPLAVEREGLDEYSWRSRQVEKCGHVAQILLHAWGEKDFNSKPLLYKWLLRFLDTVAQLGLPFSAVRQLLAVGSPIFTAITRSVPDFLARLEFAELVQMKPREREDLIASSKNRLLGFLSSPVVDAALSGATSAFNPKQLIQQNAILLFDLASHSVLRKEDQEIFSNLWLSELLHAIYATEQGQRVPHFIFIDELPVFSACAPLITDNIRQVRKYLARFVCAFQGANFFDNRADDQLLHALIGQTGAQFFFRHIDPYDAKFFAEVISLPGFHPKKVKYRHTQTQQYQDGNDVVVLTDQAASEGETETDGGSSSTATTEADNWTEQNGSTSTTTTGTARDQETLRATVQRAKAEASNRSSSKGGSTARQNSQGSNWSRAKNRSRSQTLKQTLVPRLRWREIVTSVEFYTPEEQVMVPAAQLARLSTGRAFLYIAGHGAAQVTIPYLADPSAQTPKAVARKEAAFRSQLLERPAYELPAIVQAEHQAFLDAWLGQLKALPSRDRQSKRPAKLPPAAADSHSALPLIIPDLLVPDDPDDSPLSI